MIRLNLLILILPSLLLFPTGNAEESQDPVYGIGFPQSIDSSNSLPAEVEIAGNEEEFRDPVYGIESPQSIDSSNSLPAEVEIAANEEEFRDPVYGIGFPQSIDSSNSLPAEVEIGKGTLKGVLSQIGNAPFTQLTLRIRIEDTSYYYILDDEHVADIIPPDSTIVILRGNIFINPIYLINNKLANVEYHLRDIELIEG